VLAAVGIVLPVGLARRTLSQDGQLRYHRSIGEVDGPLAFGRIGPLAAQDTLLAIADGMACQAVIYHTGEGRFVSRWGGCGGGPGEFREITAMAWRADSLFAADKRGNVISVLGPTGSEIRRIRPDVGAFVLRIGHVGFADDTTLILGIALPPSVMVRGETRQGVHAFIALVDVRTGELRARLFEDPDRESVDNRVPAVRDIKMCTARGHGRGTIAVLSPWRFHGTILRVLGTDRSSVEFDRDVRGFRPRQGKSGEWHRVGYPSIGCGDEVVMFKWVRPRTRSSPPTGGYLELRDYNGRLLMQQALTPADSAQFGSIGTAFGNRFYLIINTLFEVPVVLEYLFEGVTR
jgi:hypothetical protein